MPVIEARGLRKTFGPTIALDGIDLNVEEGRILGMIGPNGAGKTTALNAVLGLTPYEGALKVLGRDPWNERDELMRDVCFIADVATLPRWIRVSQAIDYVAGVHPRFDRAKAEAFLAKTSIGHTSRVRELSKGMVVQLHLALVMAIDARLLVLDEPTLGLDILYRKQFYDSLLNDYFDRSRTIVVTTHQVEEVQHVLTDLMFISRGRIVLSCSMDELESRYVELMVRPEQLAAARALKPMHERQALGRSILLFDGVDRQQLAPLGEVRVPGIADLFVAVVGGANSMNTESGALNEPIDSQRSAISVISPTRAFYWSLRREIWENRSIYIAPLLAACVFLFGFLINVFSLRRRMAASPLGPGELQDLLQARYELAAALIMGIELIVGLFYSLDALYGERRDRSILFWKSLPLSDLTTVLSKFTIPMIVLPIVGFLITIAAQLIMLVLSSATLLGSGTSIASLWEHVSFFQMSVVWLYHFLTVHGLWYAPFYGWLFLVSAWAPRTPFIWAFAPPFVMCGLEKIAFNTTYCLSLIVNRLGGPQASLGMTPDSSHRHLTSTLIPVHFFSEPGLWIGFAVAAAFLFGAIRLRRYRGPI